MVFFLVLESASKVSEIGIGVGIRSRIFSIFGVGVGVEWVQGLESESEVGVE